MSPQAYIVLGPESSGTRLMTEILINAGCVGSFDHVQPFDNEDYDLYQHDSIVWRRSVPHSKLPLNLSKIYPRLSGFDEIQAVVMTRDLYCMSRSQVRDHQHADCEEQARANIQDAYIRIFAQISEYDIPFIVVPYESLVLGGDQAQRNILSLLGLSIPHSMIHVRDENEKYILCKGEITIND